MWNFMIPALQAVGINAGVNLLRGKPLLQNAGMSAITGGTLGGSNSLLGQTEFGKSIFGAPVGSSVTAGATPTNVVVPGSLETMGMKTIGDTAYNPEYYTGLGFGTPMYTGGQGLLSNVWGDVKANIPDYVTPQNVLGAANILSQSQTPQAPSVSQIASKLQGGTVGNVDYGMAKPIPRKRGYA